MLPEKAYEKFILKINKNAQTNNIACDRGKFVEIYTESEDKEIEHILKKRDDDSIRYVQHLLVPSKIIKENKKEATYQLFPLPADFFDFSTVFGVASKDCCKEVIIDMEEIKSENENPELFDSNTEPSFEWRESLYYLSGGNIKAFIKDFLFDSLNITYYRYPNKISLVNPDDPESKFASTEIELDNKLVNRIISRAAAEFEMNNGNPKYQVDLQRTIQK